MKENPLLKYAEQLAVQIDALCKTLESKDNSNTVFQIRKSSSSVFANITEAQFPQSLPDMLSKFKIARKECVETESWLKILYANGSINEETFKKFRNLCGRIQRMLTASCITIEKKTVYKGKMLFNMYLTVPFMAFSTVCLCISAKVSLLNTVN